MKLSNTKTYIIEIIANMLTDTATGIENSKFGSELLLMLKEKHSIDLHNREFREMIRILRSTWRIKNLVAGSNGYFIATKKEDTEKYLSRLNNIIINTQIIIDSFDQEDVLDIGQTFKIIESDDDY